MTGLILKYDAAKIFGAEALEGILAAIDPLLSDADKFKQRAGAEILSGILRGEYRSATALTFFIYTTQGSKHWPKLLSDRLWQWTTSRLDRIFAQIKPDTLSFWEGFFQVASFSFNLSIFMRIPFLVPIKGS